MRNYSRIFTGRFLGFTAALLLLTSAAHADGFKNTAFVKPWQKFSLLTADLQMRSVLSWVRTVPQRAAPSRWHFFGIRGDFSDVQTRPPEFELLTVGRDFFGGSIDLKYYPLQPLAKPRAVFDPYVMVGMGGFYREPSMDLEAERRPGLGGNLTVGWNLHFTDNVTLVMEQSYRPRFTDETLRFKPDNPDPSSSDLLFTYMALLRCRF